MTKAEKELEEIILKKTGQCLEEEKEDVVNHPSHYNREGAMQPIEEMEIVFGHCGVRVICLGNIWKYRARALDKNGKEDIEKSDWYMRKYNETMDLIHKYISAEMWSNYIALEAEINAIISESIEANKNH